MSEDFRKVINEMKASETEYFDGCEGRIYFDMENELPQWIKVLERTYDLYMEMYHTLIEKED